MPNLLTIKEASLFATQFTQKNITPSNITYLVNYGRIAKSSARGSTLIDKAELIRYYLSHLSGKAESWKRQLGRDLNWALSFDHLKEADTTKHVHRLHPYKGKFIPQLVEYFLDGHTDEFKTQVFFEKNDIVLDPFCGSGTTLVQANELGMHAVGIDVSIFNTLMANVKIQKIDLIALHRKISDLRQELRQFTFSNQNMNFETALLAELNIFNKKYYPSPEFKIQVRQGRIDEGRHFAEHRQEIEDAFRRLLGMYKINIEQDANSQFLDRWYVEPVRKEIDFLYERIRQIQDESLKNTLIIILSRTMRSCRATTHADLATLKEPVLAPYYCAKHGKVCKPLFTLLSWWERYTTDTLKRLQTFDSLRTPTEQVCLHGDATELDIFACLEKQNKRLFALAKEKKIKGIFSSPPYVGLIDYHEQHAYAYNLFGFERRDNLEIGPLSKRQSKQAQQEYLEGVAAVLINCKRFLQADYSVFLVANDRFNLYPSIAERAGMKIVKRYKRPVLNRTEKDKSPYSEEIFCLKEQSN